MGPQYKLTQADIAINYYVVLGAGERWSNDHSEPRCRPFHPAPLELPTDPQSRTISTRSTRRTAGWFLSAIPRKRSGSCVAVSTPQTVLFMMCTLPYIARVSFGCFAGHRGRAYALPHDDLATSARHHTVSQSQNIVICPPPPTPRCHLLTSRCSRDSPHPPPPTV